MVKNQQSQTKKHSWQVRDLFYGTSLWHLSQGLQSTSESGRKGGGESFWRKQQSRGKVGKVVGKGGGVIAPSLSLSVAPVSPGRILPTCTQRMFHLHLWTFFSHLLFLPWTKEHNMKYREHYITTTFWQVILTMTTWSHQKVIIDYFTFEMTIVSFGSERYKMGCS